MPTATLDTPARLDSYTLAEIAEAVCQADRLPPEARPSILRKVRRLVAGGQLQGGEQLSGRGTWHYPAREIYRCAILLDFGRQGVVDAAPAERALTGGIYNSLGRHRDSATTGIDALLAAVRATDSPIILEVADVRLRGQRQHARPRRRAHALAR